MKNIKWYFNTTKYKPSTFGCKYLRIAVIDYDLCKPTKCNLECIRFCPVNRGSTIAIEIPKGEKKPVIYESTCIGCAICVKKCPFGAIEIVNLPDKLSSELIHRYRKNGFELLGLPTPKLGKIVGLLGKNGSGKTTILKILAGELLPNFGDAEKNFSKEEVLKRFRGKEIHDYLYNVYNGKIRVIHKMQHVEKISRTIKGKVIDILKKIDEKGILENLIKDFNLNQILNKDIQYLSGGELQKIAIAAAIIRKGDAYLFDEPASYLDIKERINMAKIIKKYLKNAYVIIVEHDLSILDYLADIIHIVYGEPSVYGKVSKSYSVRNGINYFIEGYLPSENVLIRKEKIEFNVRQKIENSKDFGEVSLQWTDIYVNLGDFSLEVEQGSVNEGEVIGILGPNGIGKTTFVRIIAKEIAPTKGEIKTGVKKISYKPQKLVPDDFNGKVGELLNLTTKELTQNSSWFYEEVIKKLGLHKLIDMNASELSGGELQKLAISLTLAKEADIYLIDEPSSYIDAEERFIVSKAIKKVTEEKRKTTIIVDHDLNVIDYVADKVIVFGGEPGKFGRAGKPEPMIFGINNFLKDVDITFRRDRQTKRPRVNKENSYLDRLQKSSGNYYSIEEIEETDNEKD